MSSASSSFFEPGVSVPDSFFRVFSFVRLFSLLLSHTYTFYSQAFPHRIGNGTANFVKKIDGNLSIQCLTASGRFVESAEPFQGLFHIHSKYLGVKYV